MPTPRTFLTTWIVCCIVALLDTRLYAATAAKEATAEPLPATAAALRYRTANLEAFHSDLLDLAKHPSISALPQHTPDILAAAEW